MDWDLENEVTQLKSMITVYQDHIEELQQELKEKAAKIKFLEQQLEYKSMGPPDTDAVDTQTLFTKSRNLR